MDHNCFNLAKATQETLYEILDACIECLNDGTISEEDAQKFCVDKLPQDAEDVE